MINYHPDLTLTFEAGDIDTISRALDEAWQNWQDTIDGMNERRVILTRLKPRQARQGLQRIDARIESARARQRSIEKTQQQIEVHYDPRGAAR